MEGIILDKERLNFLLHALATGQLNRNDYDELLGYIHHTQSEGMLLEGMEEILQEINALPPPAGGPDEALYAAIQSKLPGAKPPVRYLLLRRSVAVAAGVLLVIGAITLFRVVNNRPAAAEEALVTISTDAGKRIEVSLPDSSHVWLNAGSRLRYSKTFSNDRRELVLEGEAFFDVKKDAHRPFVVHTGNVSTTVLGTAFDINAYDTLSLSVTVTRGRVKVSTPGRELALLTVNKQLQYRRPGESAVVRDVNAEDAAAWKNGDLIFNNTSVEEAAVVMERWFGVRVEFSDPAIRQYRFSVSFHKGVTISEAMNVISALNNFSFRLAGDTVILNH